MGKTDCAQGEKISRVRKERKPISIATVPHGWGHGGAREHDKAASGGDS